MEKLLQMLMYFSWALWLVYSYVVLFSRKDKPDRKLLVFTFFALAALIVLLKSRMMILFSVIALLVILFGMFRRSSKRKSAEVPGPVPEPQTLFHTFFGMGLATIAVVSLFFLLSRDFKSDANYFLEKYNFNIQSHKSSKEIIIGNAKADSHITLENNSSDNAHLRLILNEKDFYVQNISEKKKVDLNGRYLNKLVLQTGDEIEIMGKEKITLLKMNKQYPLGRSLQVSIKKPGQKKGEVRTLHTFLNKSFIIKYRKMKRPHVLTGLNKLVLPGRRETVAAVVSYEPHRYFLGMNIYYIIVFFTILLLCVGIYFYLRNRFNGALLLLMMASLPFMSGFISLLAEIVLILLFLPFIIYIHRRSGKGGWNWGAVLLVLLFAAIFVLPLMMRMEGDFTLQYYDFSKKESLRVTRGNETFHLKDLKKKLAYEKKYRLILGHTAYRMRVSRDNLSLIPLNPEKIRVSPKYKAIISDLKLAAPGEHYVYLKFPHEFEPIPFAAASGKKRLTISDDKGNSIVLSKIVNENYSFYLKGLIFFVLLPFWFFLVVNYPGLPLGKRRRFQLELFNKNNLIIYNFVFFMLGLGYVVFGALALYNNSFFKNFRKFRDQALPLFVILFFLSLLLSRYNRWLVFLYRALIRKKFHVPLITGTILILLVNYSVVFLFAGILFFIFVFIFRLRRDIYYQYKHSCSYPLDIKEICEKPIANFEEKANQGIFFGLGGVLNRKGWNYLLVSDLLLLLALFFIVLQMFLGGELGVSVAGFFFMPIELGKILLAIYFADWVSRIDKGMELSVLWVYGLVLIPFVLLVMFLKDFSPLLVFSFVFFYHIIKIKKPLLFKLFLATLIFLTTVMVVTDLNRYTFPFTYFGIILSILLIFFLLRLWFKKTNKPSVKIAKPVVGSLAIILLLIVNYVSFFHTPSAPRSLAGRVSSWLNPWQDYNLSYQYVNSLWLMKGAGTFGKSADALITAGHVPLIEKDLSFSLYVSVLGTIGTAFIFFTLFLIAAYVHKLVRQYEEQDRRSPFRWYLYLLEFLAVIFLAQFLVPALYVVGLLPIMGQPLPFLSYSNNMLLLFALPFSFLMIVLGNNLTFVEKDNGFNGKN